MSYLLLSFFTTNRPAVCYHLYGEKHISKDATCSTESLSREKLPSSAEMHEWLVYAASIPVVGFNAILMSEHFGSFLVFGVLHGALAINYVKVSPQTTSFSMLQT